MENLAPHQDSIPGPSSPYRVAIPTELSLHINIVTEFSEIRYLPTYLPTNLNCAMSQPIANSVARVAISVLARTRSVGINQSITSRDTYRILN